MRFILSLLLCLAFSLAFSQGEKKSFKGITLSEEFTSNDYSVPDSLLFYSDGHWEIEKYYKILFRKLKKEFKNTNIKTEYVFERNDSVSEMVKSFKDLKIKNKLKKNNIICVFAVSNLESNFFRISKRTGQTFFVNKKKIMYYNMYLMLLDTRKNKILLKRKFSVEANEIYHANNKNLAKAIAQEIKI